MDCNCEKAPEFPTKAFIPGPIEIPINFRAVTIPADQGDDVANPPLNGAYRNVVLKYAANGHTYIYSSDGIPVMLVGSVTFDSLPDRPKYDGQPMTSHTDIPDLSDEVQTLQAEVQALATDFSYKGSVADYAHLPNDAEVGDVYTTTDTGVIYVWDGDEWVALNDASITTFYVSSAETGATRHIYKDAAFVTPATVQNISDASHGGIVVLRGYNINTPSQYNEIVLVNVWQSPDDNDYQFVFAGDGIAHTYSAEALSDDVFSYYSAKYMFGNKLQTTGTSTTDVMSQKAVTDMVYVPNSNESSIRIGKDASVTDASAAIGIGRNVSVATNGATAIGDHAQARAFGAIAIGGHANASKQGAIALGEYSDSNTQGLIQVSSPQINCTYNNSGYRLLSGLYDPQSAHDAATKGYVDGITTRSNHAPNSNFSGTVGQLWEDTTNGDLYICTAVTPQGTDPETYTYTWEEFLTTSDLVQIAAQGNTLSTSAPTTTTEGVLGQLYTDTTNMHTYQCTAIDTTDPDNPLYTWTQRW